MSADLSGFFKDYDLQGMVIFLGQLHQATGRGESGGSAADNQDIDLHRVTLGGLNGILHGFGSPKRDHQCRVLGALSIMSYEVFPSICYIAGWFHCTGSVS